jgi:hypothetical protein
MTQPNPVRILLRTMRPEKGLIHCANHLSHSNAFVKVKITLRLFNYAPRNEDVWASDHIDPRIFNFVTR